MPSTVPRDGSACGIGSTGRGRVSRTAALFAAAHEHRPVPRAARLVRPWQFAAGDFDSRAGRRYLNRMADELIHALAFEGRARVVAAETTSTVEELRGIHYLSPTASAALGRVATGALLLATALEKVTEREPVLTIEVEGNGPIGRVLATASPRGWVRALARNGSADVVPRPDGKLDVGGLVGRQGTLSVARDLGNGQPYRGVVPLVNGEVATDLAHYLRDSEQIPAAVVLGVMVARDRGVTHAGGLVVQLLPGVPEHEADALSARLREFGEVTTQLRAGQRPLDWLDRLFPGGYDVLERRRVEFRCGCSMDRVERALKLLGPSEVTALLRQTERQQQPAQVTCEFCHKSYRLQGEDLQRLLAELRDEAPPAATA